MSAAPLAPSDWERLLGLELGRRVRVRYGRARTSVVRSLPQRDGSLELRLNAMFADAPAGVQRALAIWLRSGARAPKASLELDRWIEARLVRLHREEPRAAPSSTRGRHHDLAALAAQLLQREFAGVFDARGGPPCLTWGRAGASRSRHSLRLGSYDFAARVVRVHRVLDAHDVPEWFVRYVLFHELLHAAFEESDRRGRRLLHGPRFKEREARYPDFERARAWESRHVAALIRRARRGDVQPNPEPTPAPALPRRPAQGLLFEDA
jgi:hypothetical protein